MRRPPPSPPRRLLTFIAPAGRPIPDTALFQTAGLSIEEVVTKLADFHPSTWAVPLKDDVPRPRPRREFEPVASPAPPKYRGPSLAPDYQQQLQGPRRPPPELRALVATVHFNIRLRMAAALEARTGMSTSKYSPATRARLRPVWDAIQAFMGPAFSQPAIHEHNIKRANVIALLRRRSLKVPKARATTATTSTSAPKPVPRTFGPKHRLSRGLPPMTKFGKARR